jgi:hypothetical protein
MSQGSKSAYYRALKDSGATLTKHYREYTTDELRQLATAQGLQVAEPAPADPLPPAPNEMAEVREQLNGLAGVVGKLATLLLAERTQPPIPADYSVQPGGPRAPQSPVPQPGTPVNPQVAFAKPEPSAPGLVNGVNPLEHAGVLLNSKKQGEVLYVDEQGNEWYQPEVNKPGYAKGRVRRVYRDVASEMTTETIQVGNYIETFEVPDDSRRTKTVEAKITLPSYQTGIFKAPGIPFKIHTYQGNRGFDWDDVVQFYGAPDLVPDTIKKVYVSSDLCFDIPTTKRAIDREYRERVLNMKETV